MMGVATVGGTMNCTMCGSPGFRTMTLLHGERYTCSSCNQEGIWRVGGLMPLPWDACPRGMIPSLWAAAVKEVVELEAHAIRIHSTPAIRRFTDVG